MSRNAQYRRCSGNGCIEHLAQQLAMIHGRYTCSRAFGDEPGIILLLVNPVAVVHHVADGTAAKDRDPAVPQFYAN